MKNILYIFFGGDVNETTSGVQKKIVSKIQKINEIDGVYCHGAFFSNKVTVSTAFNNEITLYPFYNYRRKYFNAFYQNSLIYQALTEFLKNNYNNYSHIIFRYPLASRCLYELVKQYGDKIVFEHNTMEIEEIHLDSIQFRKSFKPTLSPSALSYYLERGFLSVWQEKHYGPKIFKHAKLGIAVTNEIALYENRRQPLYQLKTVTNGVDILNCKLRKSNFFYEKELKLFMLLGSANSWNGVDRLVHSLEKYSGECHITVDIIGALTKDDKAVINNSPIKNQIKMVEFLNATELDEKLNNYHLAMGSLAGFRKGLIEGTALKTREYLARGFPMVLGYLDTDFLNHKEFEPYYLQEKLDESFIDFNRIIEFVKTVYKDESHPTKIRNLAIKYLDTKVKAKQLIDCLD